MPTFTAGVFGVDFDQLDIGALASGAISTASDSIFTLQAGLYVDTFQGSGFTYGSTGLFTGGVVSQIQQTYLGQSVFVLSGLSTPAASFTTWALSGGDAAAKLSIFGGADLITGSDSNDRLRGFDGPDTINAGGGADYVDGGGGGDIIHGNLGDDVIVESAGANYLRGDEGDDSIQGGSGFDDINGNMGNDTLSGGPGDDWVVGGKDNDSQSGDAGNDIVWGNLGDDTLSGGDGDDQVRGGQGNDSISGGAGNDYISGDRGNDTESGGPGADRFHGSQDAGIDKVLDFNLAEGDRVMLDPGTTYTVSQVGADTVIDMGGGNQMILVGVQMSTLTSGWIFESY